MARARERALRRLPRVAMSSSPEQRSTAGCSESSTMARNLYDGRGYTQAHAYARRGRGRAGECHRPRARPRLRRARADLRGRDRRRHVHVTFTLTTPACPIGPQVTEQIDEFVIRARRGRRGVLLDGVHAPVDAGEDERGREVRTRLLSRELQGRSLGYRPPPMRRALVLLSLGLVVAPAAHAQAPQTGRLLVTLAPGAAPRARARPPPRSRRRPRARPAGFSVPQIRLVTRSPAHAAAPARAGAAPARRPARGPRRGRAPRPPALGTQRPGPDHPRDGGRHGVRHAGRVVGRAQRLPARLGRVHRRGRDGRGHRHRRRDQPSGAGRSRAGRRAFVDDGNARRRRTVSATARTSPRWPAAPATTASAWPVRACAAGC